MYIFHEREKSPPIPLGAASFLTYTPFFELGLRGDVA